MSSETSRKLHEMEKPFFSYPISTEERGAGKMIVEQKLKSACQTKQFTDLDFHSFNEGIGPTKTESMYAILKTVQ